MKRSLDKARRYHASVFQWFRHPCGRFWVARTIYRSTPTTKIGEIATRIKR